MGADGKPADPSTEPLEGAQASLPIAGVQSGLQADRAKPLIVQRHDGERDPNKKEISAVQNNGIDNYTTHPLRLEQKTNGIDNHTTHPLCLGQEKLAWERGTLMIRWIML